MTEAGWKEVAITDLVSINPETLGTTTPFNERFRYIDISAVTPGRVEWANVPELEFRQAPSRARRLVRPGDTLFCTVRPGLQAHAHADWQQQNGFVCSTGFAVLHPRHSKSSRFVFHTVFGDAVVEQVRRLEIGSSYPAVNETDLSKIILHIPESPVHQARIAEILDTLDAMIRETEAVVAKLRQVKAGLLHDLLTRGVEEHGYLRDPASHPEQFQDSPLGRIPKSWEIVPLGRHAKFITSGSRAWATYYAKDGALFLRVGNLTREHINLRFDDRVFVQPPLGSEGSRTRVQPGDLLISITADLGITGVIPDSFGEAYVNQHLTLIRLRTDELNPRYAANYLAGETGQRQFAALNDSGAKAGLSLPSVADLRITKPELNSTLANQAANGTPWIKRSRASPGNCMNSAWGGEFTKYRARQRWRRTRARQSANVGSPL